MVLLDRVRIKGLSAAQGGRQCDRLALDGAKAWLSSLPRGSYFNQPGDVLFQITDLARDEGQQSFMECNADIGPSVRRLQLLHGD